MHAIIPQLPTLLLQGSFFAAVLGFVGVWVSRTVAAAQLKVQQQALFVSMLPRRVEWSDQFRTTMSAWDGQMQTIINYEGDDPPEPTFLFELRRLASEAEWLFGPDVSTVAWSIVKGFEVVRNLRIQARSGGQSGHEAANLVGGAVLRVLEQATPLTDALKPKLYVGDIARPKGVVSASPRIRGFQAYSSEGQRDA